MGVVKQGLPGSMFVKKCRKNGQGATGCNEDLVIWFNIETVRSVTEAGSAFFHHVICDH